MGADHENSGSGQSPVDNDVQVDLVAQFRSELSALMAKYGFEMSADSMGDINVSTRSKYFGYWSGGIEDKYWNNF